MNSGGRSSNSDLKQSASWRHSCLSVDCPDCEDSRALSFVFHPQEFHILSFILGIQNGYSKRKPKRPNQARDGNSKSQTKAKSSESENPTLTKSKVHQ
ncbi:hypothetical protein Tco_0747934 [Tanacetum coccineum]|uniref:Uncharacterized protein n=1 Tax=Tanacetum coccineum TaxID=301880 RepID=A0ABQ4YX65_9ASTR